MILEDDPLFQKPRLQKLLGKPAKVRESTVEAHLVKRVKALGGEVRKVTWQGRRGAPDRLILIPVRPRASWLNLPSGKAHAIWIELKRPGEKPEPHQAREHERMRAFGLRVEVIDNKEAIDELLS